MYFGHFFPPLKHVLVDYFGNYFCLSSKSVANIYQSFVFIYFLRVFCLCHSRWGKVWSYFWKGYTVCFLHLRLGCMIVADIILEMEAQCQYVRQSFVVVVVGLLHHFQFCFLFCFSILFDIFVFFFVE